MSSGSARSHPSDPPLTALQNRFDDLSEQLQSAFASWSVAPAPWPEERFREAAQRAFAIQFEANLPYRRYCERLGATPAGIRRWQDIPAVPTAAFREVALVVGLPEDASGRARLEFLTSGTSSGPRKRGRHIVIAPDLYGASLEATFRHHVLGRVHASPGSRAGHGPAGGSTESGPDAGPGRVTICSLIPPFALTGDSSLAWMSDAVLDRFGADGSRSVAEAGGIRWGEARRMAETACESGTPLCVIATTLAADEWMRRLAADGVALELPEGSTVMDTGGTKGRQDLQRAHVLAAIEARLGVAPARVINEFGMTELLSQRYSTPDQDALVAPPWLRTRALDSSTLAELPPGEVGLLCHFDLANAGSVCAILTEDLGSVSDNLLKLVGRSPGAPPRGCSLATAELLDAQRVGSE